MYLKIQTYLVRTHLLLHGISSFFCLNNEDELNGHLCLLSAAMLHLSISTPMVQQGQRQIG